MAEYGVNIKASVQGQENIKKLAAQIEKITEGLEAADKAFSHFQSKLKSFDQRKREKQTNDELDDRARIYREMERMQRQLLANDNSRIKSLRKQADLEEHILNTISAGRMRRESRTALRLQGDPKAHASPIGPQRDLERESRLQLMRQTASQVEAFDAEKKFAVEMGRINERLDRKTHDIKVNMLLQEFKTEEAFQKATFEKMIALSKKELAENAEKLGIKTDAEIQAIKKVDNERRRVARESLMLTGQTSPVGGARNIPGSPAALAAAERSKRLRSASSSALIGGAFPLLFGQGAGASIGGAAGGFGGGMIGGEFGFGLSLIGTQIGAMVDQIISGASDLGAALNPLTADINAIAEASGFANTEISQSLNLINELGSEQQALQLATELLAATVGDDGVQALQEFGADTLELSNAFSRAMSLMQVAAARLFGGIAKLAAEVLKDKVDLEAALRDTDDPELQKLSKRRAGLQLSVETELQAQKDSFSAGGTSQELQDNLNEIKKIDKEMIRIQRNNREEVEKRIQAQAKELANAKILNQFGISDVKLKKIQNDLGKIEQDHTNENFVSLQRKLIAREKEIAMNEAILKVGKDENGQIRDHGLLSKLNHQINEDALIKTKKLNRDIDKAVADKLNREERAQDRISKAQERINKQTERANEKQQRAIDRKIEAVDREIERTENAFNKASQQLDSITQKHEDKMAFEREYSRLIMEGSTPAAAKQAVELKKQLLELDRGYEKLLQTVDAQIVKAETSLQDLKTQKGVTNEYIEQRKALDKLKEDRDGLKDKKGKAGGAIEEALAPKTFLDKLDDEAERLQGVLNDLVDPANQVIGAANAIGDAFSESFRGIINGSMTAQEALANLFQRTADHFLDMTAQIIAAAIKMQAIQIIGNIIGATAGGFMSPAASPGGSAGVAGIGGGMTNPFGNTSSFDAATSLPKLFAEGGYVNRPTNALIGEGGEPEYVIPQSKMRESMSRYSRGSRGGGVIPSDGGSSASGDGGVAVAAPIDVRYTVERINSVDYVTADQFQSGMQRAASQGAQRGEQNTLKRLQMSGSTRRRLGM